MILLHYMQSNQLVDHQQEPTKWEPILRTTDESCTSQLIQLMYWT
jgi:hypothetical protein